MALLAPDLLAQGALRTMLVLLFVQGSGCTACAQGFTSRRQATSNALLALLTRPTPRARLLKLLALAMQATEAMLSQAAAL